MDSIKHIIPFMIPIVGIIMGVGIGMLALWLDHQKKTHILDLHHKERLLAIERGMEVPPLPTELLQNNPKTERNIESSLRSGLILVLLGLAIGIALAVNASPEAATWALIPLAIGGAQLLFYVIAGKQKQPL